MSYLVRMNIYRLERLPYPKAHIYDCYDGFVIVAAHEAEARLLANGTFADEGRIWEDHSKASCELVGVAAPGQEAGIILSDFHAG